MLEVMTGIWRAFRDWAIENQNHWVRLPRGCGNGWSGIYRASGVRCLLNHYLGADGDAVVEVDNVLVCHTEAAG